MFRWKTVISLLVVAVIGTAAGVAWAQDNLDPQGGPPEATPPPGAEANALGAGLTEDDFVPITPCRLIDTRRGGGPVQVGAINTYAVVGSSISFAVQGGQPGGCGIPNNASAISATITAVNARSGFLRAWPAGSPAPNATFMNYDDAFNVSNTGTLPICTGLCQANSDLNLRAFGSETDIVADVAGYYIPKMAAYVDAAGNLLRGNRVLSTGTVSGAGTYEIRFDRDVSNCTYSATVNTSGGDGWAAAAARGGQADSVFVITHGNDGEVSGRRFMVEVTC